MERGSLTLAAAATRGEDRGQSCSREAATSSKTAGVSPWSSKADISEPRSGDVVVVAHTTSQLRSSYGSITLFPRAYTRGYRRHRVSDPH